MPLAAARKRQAALNLFFFQKAVLGQKSPVGLVNELDGAVVPHGQAVEAERSALALPRSSRPARHRKSPKGYLSGRRVRPCATES